MKEKIAEFFENHSHWIFYVWFVSVFTFMMVLFTDANLFYILCIAGIALGSTALIAWALYSYQRAEQDRIFRQQREALGVEDEPVMQPRVRTNRLKKPSKKNVGYTPEIAMSDEEIDRRIRFYNKHHKK